MSLEAGSSIASGAYETQQRSDLVAPPGRLPIRTISQEIREAYTIDCDEDKSIGLFCNEINKNISSFIKLYRKSQKQSPNLKFFLTPNHSDDTPEKISDEVGKGAIPDGAGSLALMATEPNRARPIFVAVAGYGLPPSRVGWAYRDEMEEKELTDESLVIVQLQGPLKDYRKRARTIAYETLKNFRWEEFMTDMLIEWAKCVGFKNVYMIPADFNHYKDKDIPGLKERLKKHYDDTAIARGFEMDKKTGLWKLSLV
jgi:hypothetical protein